MSEKDGEDTARDVVIESEEAKRKRILRSSDIFINGFRKDAGGAEARTDMRTANPNPNPNPNPRLVRI